MNRKQRRATQAKAETKIDYTAPMPNISGNDQRCGNCAHAVNNDPDRKRNFAAIRRLHNQPMLPEDETLCLQGPQEKGKKTWGWCAQWTAVAPAGGK